MVNRIRRFAFLVTFFIAAGGNSSLAHANSAPVITGTPGTHVNVGAGYVFQPQGSDRDGQRLTYGIRNKPSWVSFSPGNGKVWGKPGPGHVGTTSGIVITVSDGKLRTELPAFSLTVLGAGNRAPTVSGVPAARADVGVNYRFVPTGRDPDGDAIKWSIANKPAGASFNTATGQLDWTPASASVASRIVITAIDARGASASLPAFSVSVAQPAVVRTATLVWAAPTLYRDGSALSPADLAGYRVYMGSGPASLSRVAEVDARTLLFTIRNLVAGTHYFAVTAVNSLGTESDPSEIMHKSFK